MRGQAPEVVDGALGDHKPHPVNLRSRALGKLGWRHDERQQERFAQRLDRVLEAVTRQSGRLSQTPEFGSWLLGKVSESQRRRRVRIQVILTVFIVGVNLLGIGVATLLVAVAFPVPSIFTDAPAWLTFGVSPAYIVLALVLGTFWITRRTVDELRWSIEKRTSCSLWCSPYRCRI